MIFFYGTRATKVKQRKLHKTTCPYCSTADSFIVRTYSKYFHFFWIPILPLFKTNVAECTHCKKSYALGEFTAEMQRSLAREDQTNPAKRPLWQGCGCLVLVVFFVIMMSISFYGVYSRSQNSSDVKTEIDVRKQLLKTDMDDMTTQINRNQDSISFLLKECVDYDIVGGLDTSDIAYFTKLKDDKLLVLMRIKNIKKIKPEFRKDILNVIEDCLDQQQMLKEVHQIYIGIEGKWNTILVKTPTDADLGGRYADKYKLMSFYNEAVVRDTLINP